MKIAVKSAVVTVFLSMPAVATASYLDVVVEGTLTGPNQLGPFHYNGLTWLDFLTTGAPIAISLRIDTSQLQVNPAFNTGPYVEYEKTQTPTPAVVSSGLLLGNSPLTFSLTGGPSTLHSLSKYQEGCYVSDPNDPCIITPDQPLPNENVYEIYEVKSETLSLGKSNGNPDLSTFSWSFNASWITRDSYPDPQFPGNYSSNVAFSFRDLFGESFADTALTSPVSYAGNGEDIGYFYFSSGEAGDHTYSWFKVNFDVSKVTISPVAPVPEIETWAMLGIGGAIIGWAMRRRLRIDTTTGTAIAI